MLDKDVPELIIYSIIISDVLIAISITLYHLIDNGIFYNLNNITLSVNW
ncbi:MAG: hypothetical protein PHT51_02855 [Patescibacteria group bacterium]|nr:hypothetical protein [Patescibacteria group bacterium]MDD4610810.1 hypothetical protein [Patescibacteria group bacterium]